jgi:hypothetical protein
MAPSCQLSTATIEPASVEAPVEHAFCGLAASQQAIGYHYRPNRNPILPAVAVAAAG